MTTDLLKNFPLRRGRFCLWRYEERNGRRTKMPYNPETLTPAESNHPTTFTKFEVAAKQYEQHRDRFNGLGFRLDGDFCAIDIDHCRNKETGELTPEAREVVELLDRYTEASPSGEGIHVFFTARRLARAVSDRTGRPCETDEQLAAAYKSRWYTRKKTFEFYARFTNRYMTVTGDALEGYGGNLMDIDRGDPDGVSRVEERLLDVLDKFYRRDEATPQTVDIRPQSTASLDLSDRELLERAFAAKNGAKFRALWEGDISDYEGRGNQSSADLALMSLLAFWTNGDRVRMLRLFNQSALAQRDKWKNRPSYQQSTLDAALKGWRKGYDPGEYYRSDVSSDFHDEGDEDAPKKKDDELTEEEKKARFEENKAKYLSQVAANNVEAFFDEIDEKANTPAIPTGFRYLDNALDGGLYEGLYEIGGISSVGKTAFCLQLADQIAAQGHDVVIFSLEMSKFQLMARSISRGTFELLRKREGFRRYDPEKYADYARTTRQITRGERWRYYKREALDLIAQAAKNYKQGAAPHLWLIEGMGTTGIKEIRQGVADHEAYTGKAPVVLVDYQQILEPYSERMTDKQNTDKAVKLLKILSRDFKIPVIAISSLNRANYKNSIDMEAFKESGAIEYSSDILIGLQLRGTGMKFMDMATGKTTEFDVKAAKAKDPRDIEAVVLKNREGATGLTLNFRYYPKYNAFRNYEIKAAKRDVVETTVATEVEGAE